MAEARVNIAASPIGPSVPTVSQDGFNRAGQGDTAETSKSL